MSKWLIIFCVILLIGCGGEQVQDLGNVNENIIEEPFLNEDYNPNNDPALLELDESLKELDELD